MKSYSLAICTLLFCSGLCALVFQTAWLREFRLVFGGSTAASGAVLAIFMGGLGCGNLFFGKRVDQQQNPLAYYARLEFWIGISAAATPFLLDLVRIIYCALGGRMALGLTGATGLRLALSTIVLSIPTFLMGGTLPAASRAATDAEDSHRRSLALLYGLNTLGAVCGTLLSTFWLMEHLGTRQTLWLACGVNLAIALVARRLARDVRSSAPSQNSASARPLSRVERRQQKSARRAEADSPPCAAGLICTAAGVLGFAFFLMELVWFRMLGPLLGGTTFTFGLILAVALLGIGLGGAAYAALFRKATPTPGAFALSCGLEAVCIAYPFALGDRIALWSTLLREHSADSFAMTALGWSAIAAIVILPAAFVSGLQFPLLIALLGKGKQEVGQQVGLAFAANTAGAIVGSLAGGFGILPWLSAPGTWAAVVVLLATLCGALVAENVRRSGLSRGLAAPLSAATAALALLMSTGPTAVWRHSIPVVGQARANSLQDRANFYRRRVLWESEGTESAIAIIAADGLAFISNGKSDGNAILDAGTQIMGGLLGAMLHPDPKSCFVVGLGTGETAGWLAAVDSITGVTVVELEPAVDEMARRCASVNHNVLEHPKVRRVYDDAREVLLTSADRHDLIVSEPSNPYRAGVANLYTREFYLAARNRLNADGIFAQWLQMYAVDEETLQTVIATLRTIFPYVEVWETETKDSLFICSAEPIALDVPKLRDRIKQEPFKSALAHAWRTDDLEGVFAHFVAGSSVIEKWNRAAGTLWNTDDRNLVEYGFARTASRASEFSLARLREAALAHGERVPRDIEGEIDLERVGDQYFAECLLAGVNESTSWNFSEAQRARGDALRFILTGNSARGLRAWRSQPREPQYPLEISLLALAYADQSDPQALTLAERIETSQPVEAQAIRARYYARTRDTARAVEALEKVFVALRDDPWPQSAVLEHVFRLSVEIGREDRALAARMHDALSRPFALFRMEEDRRRAALVLALTLDPSVASQRFAEFEPHIPWSRRFLENRARVYSVTEHALARQAQRDLETFHEQSQRR